jgi:hypothetical protein
LTDDDADGLCPNDNSAPSQSQAGDSSSTPAGQSQSSDTSGNTTSEPTSGTDSSNSQNSNQNTSTPTQGKQQTDGDDDDGKNQDDDTSTPCPTDEQTSSTDGGPTPIPVTWPTCPGSSTPSSTNPNGNSTGNTSGPTNNNTNGPGQPAPGTTTALPPPPGGPLGPGIPGIPGFPGLPPSMTGLPNPGDPNYLLAGSCLGLSEGWGDGVNDGSSGAPDNRGNEACTASQHAPTDDPAVSQWNVDYSLGVEDGYPLGYSYGSAYARVLAAAEAETDPNPADVAAMQAAAQQYLSLIQSTGCMSYVTSMSPNAPTPTPTSPSGPSPCSPSSYSSSDNSS